jgi:amino acid adenylation domain-containing protein/non-ribosomal peptide synthase protein (TIGR01720 family)
MTDAPVAVIGVHCRVPGARSADELWAALRSGAESITRFSDDELLRAGVDRAVLDDPDYVKSRGVIDDIEAFDASLFGYTPREAELLDPQHRVFLECAWESLELAGYLDDPALRTGVFAGCGANSYLLHNLASHRRLLRSTDHHQLLLASEKDFLATRVSYKLDLRGPSVNVSTACSTSLVAVHAAAQSIARGECDVAIAGGVSIPVPHRTGYLFQESGILSPDGHCRAFDAAARGTAVGSGAAVVVLKRHDAAHADHDRILAVVRGSAINNDGAMKAGFTAPSVQGQAAVIAAALAAAGAAAGTIGYVETHGTGTPLGDPIEIAALTEAFGGRGATNAGSCAIGSIKTNIGHLDAAAGVIGLIKAVLALDHQEIPPSLHFTHPNPEIDFAASPFRVCTALTPWTRNGMPRRAGVSSFGLGGTNAHVVLEEAPDPAPAVRSARPYQIVPISAKTPEALDEAVARFERAMSAPDAPPIDDAAFTMAVGRRAFGHRRALVYGSGQPARTPAFHAESVRPVVFLFPGAGPDFAGAARELYDSEAMFREAIDRTLDGDARQVLLDPEAADAATRPSLALPALFAMEYALASLWMSWGVRPRGMIGHSAGEYAAAAVSGALALDDCIALVALRARLLESLPAGAMMSVRMAEEEIVPLLGGDLSLAAVNGAASCVVSGPAAAVAALEEMLAARGVDARRVPMAVAAHSPAVDRVLDDFRRFLDTISFHPPEIPWISNLTGTWITPEEATDPAYWCRHLRQTVRFDDGVRALFADPEQILLEVGPGQTLTALALRHPSRPQQQLVVPSMPHPQKPQPATGFLFGALGSVWAAGAAVDWRGFYAGERRRRVALPTYPFQRQRYWIDPPSETESERTETPEATTVAAALRKIVSDVSGIPAGEIGDEQNFFALGLDSLALVQVTHRLKSDLGVKLPMTRLLDELSTPALLGAHLERECTPATPSPPAADSDRSVTAIVERQLELMRLQLEMLKGSPTSPDGSPPTGTHGDDSGGTGAVQPSMAASRPTPSVPLHFGKASAAGAARSGMQQRHLEALIERYTLRTAASKAHAAEVRGVLADYRAAVGFRPAIKEMLYPIVARRAQGSRLWDLDGNEYVDLTNGFGVVLFGHQPPFLTNALREHADEALLLGPRSSHAGDAARRIAALTGVERVAFCNSGTEAVMAAIRLARARTGRSKIAIFEGAYHGHADQTLAQRGRGGVAEPVAPGIPAEAVTNTIALPYGELESLEIIRREARSLAAVLVEPVQNMRLDFQPADFLRELRTITHAAGVAYVFDEMITGFRIHPGGAQAHFGIEADLVTYGKIVGGGMPIGVVAGRAGFMDGIDGGAWRYGDASFPTTERTFFGGTFCQHPLAMIAASAVLAELERRGPALQESLNRTATEFAHRLNAYFEAEEVPIHVVHFGSAFRFVCPTSIDLFFFHLLEKGVYVWEWRGCFLAAAHTAADLDFVFRAVEESVGELRDGGFLPARSHVTAALVPLTDAQRQLWRLWQSDERGSLAYQTGLSLGIRGPLDTGRLERAVQAVVARHDALRAVIDSSGEMQRILPRVETPVTLVDLTDAQMRAWFEEKNGAPMDLTRGPLFVVHLLRLADDEHVLVLTAHHIISDGWSMTNIVEEIVSRYAGEERGGDPPMQIGDYVRWQQELLASPAAATQERYWTAVLESPIPPLEGLGDRHRPAVKSYRSRRATVQLGPAETERLRAFCREQRCTPLMLLYAAYATLVRRWSGESDLLIGLPAAGRPPQAEGLVGYCTHVLPVRSAVDGETPFVEFLARTRSLLGEAYKNQDLPFAGLVEQRRGVASALSLTFNLDRPVPVPRLPGLELRLFPHPIDFAPFELMVNVIDAGDALVVDCDYHVDRFDDATIESFLRAYHALLDEIVSAPGTPIAHLPLMPACERARILGENEKPAPITPRTINELFDEQVRRAPDVVAVVFDDERLTYAELDRCANQLAHRLRARGVGPESMAGVFLEPSLHAIVAILGVLKAGGAYVPLDPASPPERLAFLLHDSAVLVVVSQQSLAAQLPRADGRAVVLIDADADAIAQQTDSAPVTTLTPGNAAYVIYTSGSTGKPKGVVVQHDNVTRLFTATEEWFRFDERDVWTLFHSCAFDFSVWEIFGALLYGGRLVVVPFWMTRNPDAFRRLLAAERVTVLNQTPSAFRHLIRADEHGDDGDLALRLVIFGGEALDPSTLVPWFARHGDAQPRLVNMYGITETTVHVTYRPLTAADAARGGSPIGRAIPDLRLYLLDGAREPVPDGMTGEIYVGGAGVARGYWHRDAIMAERFVDDPHRPGERLYRSGDLARRLPGGEIEYRGRADEQIKIRGFRVEPGEIEAALRGHPDVADAVVVRAGTADAPQLIAYFVSGREIAGADLRTTLAAHVADYMIPAAFVRLDALPLTRNGKVDRRALPALAETASEDERPYTTPRNAVEERLAQIWRDVLGIERVGVDDNFFQLGGDSIMAMQVVARAKDAGIALTMRDIHRRPTIAELAEPLGELVPLLPIQEWFFAFGHPAPHHDNMALLLDVAPDIDAAALRRALQLLVDRHDALRASFSNDGKRWRQLIRPSARIELEEVDTADFARRAAALQAGFATFEPPLLRAALVRRGANVPARLLLIAHHLVIDGVSWRVVLEELAAAVRGRPLRAAESPARFAAQLREAVRAGAFDDEIVYWEAIGEGTSLPLPGDSAAVRESNVFALETHHRVALDEERTSRLKACGARLDDVLLAALASALAKELGAGSLLVDVEGHGRADLTADLAANPIDDADLSGAVGWFTTIHPVRLTLDRAASMPSLVDDMRRRREGIPRGGAAFLALRAFSADDDVRHRLAALPRAEILVNYLGHFDSALSDDLFLGISSDDCGAPRDPGNLRSHRLEINAYVTGGSLQIDFAYHALQLTRESIAQMAAECVAAMESLVAATLHAR